MFSLCLDFTIVCFSVDLLLFTLLRVVGICEFKDWFLLFILENFNQYSFQKFPFYNLKFNKTSVILTTYLTSYFLSLDFCAIYPNLLAVFSELFIVS